MIIHAKEKKERSLGSQLFLKAHRCDSPKCAMMRRPSRPGPHGKRPRKLSDYGQELVAKQKLKVSYGVTENQLKAIFKEAFASTGITGQKMLEALEGRLDNVLYRSGFIGSRIMGRHIIARGHIVVNGKKTTSPSYHVRPNDVITVRTESREKGMFKELKENLAKHTSPTWLSVDPGKFEIKITKNIEVAEIPPDINFVIEFYAKNN